MILLNPGPVVLSERVRQALLKPDLCHREPEFAALQSRIRENLLQIYGLDPERWTAILLTGSGTSAMEAMISSLLPETGKLLVIENGVYGERLSQIAEIHGLQHRTMQHEWGAAIDLVQLQDRLAADADIDYLAMVHHETTTGRLNDVAAVATVCRAHGVKLLLDGVSSFGAEELHWDDWNITACAATANKCLHAIPGTSFVICRRDALERSNTPARTLYLNLNTYYQQQEAGGTPFTQSIQSFYALDEALLELQEAGGWQARQTRYKELTGLVRQGFVDRDIKPLLTESETSCVLNAYHLPDGIDYTTLHDGLKDAGFIIYAGQGTLATRLFRISTMGAITKQDMQRLVEATASIV